MTPSELPRGVALVRMPVAPLHAEPRVSSAQTSQALFGHAVLLDDAQGDWHRVRTARDGYAGWAHAGYLHVAEGAATILDEARADATRAGTGDGRTSTDFEMGPDAALVRVSLGATVRVGGRALRLPLGAWLADDVAVLGGEVVPMAELPERFPLDAEAVVRTAARYFGSTSYQWGGLTPWGADCSGMVQSAYALHGVDLPRDAWQQAQVGRDVGPELAAHAPGDLLFFSDRDDRRVTHVGLVAGGGTLCHVALGRGGWAVDDLADAADPYAARLAAQLVGARRVLG